MNVQKNNHNKLSKNITIIHINEFKKEIYLINSNEKLSNEEKNKQISISSRGT